MGALKVWNASTSAWEYVAGRPVVDLISELRAPIYVSHRGGTQRNPEHTLIGYRRSMEAGFIPEQDVMPNADGDLVCMHDDTVDRTTNGTGNVISLTTDAMRQLSVKSTVPGVERQPVAFWKDVIDEFGGRRLLMPEIKGSNWTLAQRNAFYADIVARGLQKAIVVQCFTYSVCLEAVAQGLTALFLGNTQTPAQMAADGVMWVGLSNTTTATEIASYKAKGIKVLIWTIDTLSERDLWINTNGADGIFSNDAWWTSRWFPTGDTSQSATWPADPVPWPGMKGSAQFSGKTLLRGELVNNGWGPGYENYDGTSWYLGTPLHYAGPRGPRALLRSRLTFGTQAASQTRWGSVFWGVTDPEAPYDDVTADTHTGYHFLVRRNGALDLYRKDSGVAAVNIATLAAPTTPLAAAGAESSEIIVEMEINATNVIGRATWNNVTSSVSAADTTYRPTAAYFQIGVATTVLFWQDTVIRSLA